MLLTPIVHPTGELSTPKRQGTRSPASLADTARKLKMRLPRRYAPRNDNSAEPIVHPEGELITSNGDKNPFPRILSPQSLGRREGSSC
jgi:hypothetical protein